VLNRWGKDRFTTVYKFTYFELFHAHVTILIFFKTTIPDQMKQSVLSTNRQSFGGFKMEDMIYPFYTVVLMVLVCAPRSHLLLLVAG
jgi:hypothetical protein